MVLCFDTEVHCGAASLLCYAITEWLEASSCIPMRERGTAAVLWALMNDDISVSCERLICRAGLLRQQISYWFGLPNAWIMAASLVNASTDRLCWYNWMHTTPKPLLQMSKICLVFLHFSASPDAAPKDDFLFFSYFLTA